MRKLTGTVTIILLILVLCYAAKVNTIATTKAPQLENTPVASGEFFFWEGTETIQPDITDSETVECIQQAINWCIEHEGLEAERLEVDGRFGPASRRATEAFQKAVGVQQNGVFDADTVQAMKQIIDDEQQNSLLRAAATEDVNDLRTESMQVVYGGSSKEVTTSSCRCTADEKCSDCQTVYLFSAVNDLREAARKSPALETIKKALAGALKGLCDGILAD